MRPQSYTWSWQEKSMKKVKIDRYQKQRSPEPEAIDFSGPAIGTRPSNKAPLPSETEAKNNSSSERTNGPSNDQTVERRNEQPSGQTDQRTEKQSDARPDDEARAHNTYQITVPRKRVKTRHSFGIFEDQKLALDRLQMAIRDTEDEKPSLGELVQKALDDYIEAITKELPNVQMLNRTNERSDEGVSHG